jgi:NAD(P)-dependent dehydrogenase (short-subunit alcohol dehydrogenase family)
VSEAVLHGRTALITGANRGIGREIARELARRGADIAINHLADAAQAEEVATGIRTLGRRAIAVQGDVSRSADVERMVAEAIAALGAVDILVNNAGVQTWSPLLDLAESDWDRVVGTILKGSFLCTQACARGMRERGWGRVINIGSGANKLGYPKLVDYTASRGGIEGLTKVSAVELAPFGITVNCVAPGAIETERTREESPDYAGTWAGVTPLGRVGTPQDVARAVAFFAGPDAAFVTGQTLWVDGGLFTKPIWPYGS